MNIIFELFYEYIFYVFFFYLDEQFGVGEVKVKILIIVIGEKVSYKDVF